MHLRDRRTSWSMVALLLSLAGALLVGLIAWVPPLLGRDSGVQAITPGLLTVHEEAVGVITLGDGRAVSLDATGLRVVHGNDVLLRTVRSGSPVSALAGRVDATDRREEIAATLSDLTIEHVKVTPGTARYTGRVAGDDRSLPVTISVTVDGDWVRLLVDAPGADAIVLHSYQEAATLGVEPAMAGRNLRKRAWWISAGIGRATEAYVTELGTAVAIGPSKTIRAVDLRRPGHADIHVWGSVADISVTSSARYKVPGAGAR